MANQYIKTTVYGDYTLTAIDKNKINLGYQGSVSLATRYQSGPKQGQLTGRTVVIYGPSRFATDLERVTDYLQVWATEHKHGRIEANQPLQWAELQKVSRMQYL